MSIAKMLSPNTCDNEIYSVSPQIFSSSNTYHRRLKQYSSSNNLTSLIKQNPVVTPSFHEKPKSSLYLCTHKNNNNNINNSNNISTETKEILDNALNVYEEETDSSESKLFCYDLADISTFDLDNNNE